MTPCLYVMFTVCLCMYSQRLLTELIINKPLEPLDFIIDFLQRDDDGELQETKRLLFIDYTYICIRLSD